MKCNLRMAKRLWEPSQSFSLPPKITWLHLLHLHCHQLPEEPPVVLRGIPRRDQWESRGADGCQSRWICGYCPALLATPSSPLSPQIGVLGEDKHSAMRDCHHEGNQGSYFLATELPHSLKSRETDLEHTFKVHKCGTKSKYTLLPTWTVLFKSAFVEYWYILN